MRKKPHPADLHTIAQIERATRFAAVMFPGREHGFITEYAGSLAEAQALGRALEAQFPRCGRKAIITAISDSGASFPIPEGYSPQPSSSAS